MTASPITFVIPGQMAASRSSGPLQPSEGLSGHVKARVEVGARRAGGDPVRVSAVPGEDVVVLHLANGPQLVLSPETARDLMRGQSKATRSSGLAGGDVVVPSQLRWHGLEQAAPARTRGFLGDVLLKAVEVLTGFAKEPAGKFLASKVVAKVDGQVDAGVYQLSPDALAALKGGGGKLTAVPPAEGPMLVLLHGTFVDTASTFSKLWTMHPGQVRSLFQFYGNRVYGLDHPTLGQSPIANALTLAQALPNGARLHLATHSRGGLVAEVLARVCGQQGELTTADLKHFAGPDYTAQRAELKALADVVKQRGIRVDRVVRIACPARGTLLASRRLDAYLSVLRWTLQLAAVPVAPALLDFLTAVARQREDPKQLPGLAAMMPDSPLVQWLNTGTEAIPGELRVIAGDLEGDSLGSWVKTLLADAFYWTDNDIVVQTRSMYGGAPRQGGGASFLLDQGGKVTHFNYFANTRTVGALVDGLTLPQPSGYRPIGPLSWAGEDASGVRARRVRPADLPPPNERPAVFLLPGILGSHLKVGDKRVWLSLRLLGGLGRLAWHEGVADQVSPDGPIGMFYDDLAEHLESTHEVIPFAFDWRQPIEHEAARLAEALERELKARDASRKPVRLIAHSMGGVVARTVQIVAPAVWDRLMSRTGARLLMLGTPNGGSWAPMQTLSGDDTFGNALAAIGAPFQDHAARQVMAGMPGFIQLQAGLLDPALKLGDPQTWEDMARRDLAAVRDANWWHTNWTADDGGSTLAPYEWGVPPKDVLAKAVELRRQLDRQRDNDLPRFADRLLLVTGKSKYTPDGWQWTDEGLVYLNAVDGGDGRVPLTSALLPGVRTWTLNADHGSLPDTRRAFDAYVELLEQGQTDLLKPLADAAASRSGGTAPATPPLAHVLSRPSRGRQLQALRPAESMKALLATPAEAEATEVVAPASAALHITVVNGDLTFVRLPMLVGHYQSTGVTGTEAVVDRMIGGAMTASLQLGLYPQNPGEHQVFVNHRGEPDNPWRTPRPEAAIVLGLGDEGNLKPVDLTHGVRQAALAWSQRLAERGDAPATVGIASTLIGSGGLGVHPGDAASAIARGVREAADIVRRGNTLRLEAAGGDAAKAVAWPVITELTLVELYLERASDAWRGLQVLATATPGHYEVAPTVEPGTGPLRRQIDTAYRGADYDLISASEGSDEQIVFRLDTRRARTEMRAVALQVPLVRQLVRRASSDENDDPQLGRTLFQLLVPQEMEVYLGGTDRMVLELDDGTAGLPWELLDPPSDRRAGGDPRPWSVRTRLLRKLRKLHFRSRVQDASADDHVLVVGEPRIDDPLYAPLPGALAEARQVAAVLGEPRGVGAQRVRLLEHAEATTILNALFERPWRIVHIAGHGEGSANGGVVMSDGSVLGPREIQQMRTVPELVFVNCCHLASRQATAVPAAPPMPTAATTATGAKTTPVTDFPAFAASVADALIESGVRCVIAAGWAVDDAAAAVFARVLYRELLAGRRFIDAVAQAREDAWRQSDVEQGGNGNNTWAAYQCYGDPDWTFRKATGDAQAGAVDSVVEAYENISSPLGLALALEKLAVESKFQGRTPARQLEHLRHLEARFGVQWGSMGAVAEAFGLVYAEVRAFDPAIEWYGRAVASQDGSASMRASEQWLNLRARVALDHAEKATTPAARKAARADIQAVLGQLASLGAMAPTIERHCLRGSAWKRLAMLEAKAGATAAAAEARRAAAEAYGQGEALALALDHPDLYYPGVNRMATDLAAHDGLAGWPGFDADTVARVRRSQHDRCLSDPDFWCMVGLIEVDAYEAAAAGRLSPALTGLIERANDLQSRVAAPRWWDSVAVTAEYALAHWRDKALAEGSAEGPALRDWLALLRGFAGGDAKG